MIPRIPFSAAVRRNGDSRILTGRRARPDSGAQLTASRRCTAAAICVCVLLWIVAASERGLAQREQESPQPPSDHEPNPDPPAITFPEREASGTAWLPDVTPMYGRHVQTRGWELMFHGNAFAQFLYESGEDHRRGKQVGSINLGYGYGPAPGRGRPSWSARDGQPGALDDFRMWLSESARHRRSLPWRSTTSSTRMICSWNWPSHMTRPLTLRWQLYAGPAGEPALGPPGFPHRLSAFPNPIAPISHHWLDATHINFVW